MLVLCATGERLVLICMDDQRPAKLPQSTFDRCLMFNQYSFLGPPHTESASASAEKGTDCCR
jgi:hypothetical protein